MKEPIQHGSRHLFIIEHIDPSGKFKVGIKNDRPTFITIGYDFEQELCSRSVQWDITIFIQNNHFGFIQFFQKSGQGTGYSGIENPLFYKENTRMFYGDAKKSIDELLQRLH